MASTDAKLKNGNCKQKKSKHKKTSPSERFLKSIVTGKVKMINLYS